MFRLRWSSHTSIPPPLADSPIGLVGNLMTVAPLCFRHAEVRASEYDPPPQPARTSGAVRSRLHRRTCIFAILAPANGAHIAREEDRERRAEAERRREAQPVGTEAQQDESADDQPDRLRRENQAPARRAAEVSLRDRRAEHVLGALLDRVHDPELRHDRPQPRARAELVPALAE